MLKNFRFHYLNYFSQSKIESLRIMQKNNQMIIYIDQL